MTRGWIHVDAGQNFFPLERTAQPLDLTDANALRYLWAIMRGILIVCVFRAQYLDGDLGRLVACGVKNAPVNVTFESGRKATHR